MCGIVGFIDIRRGKSDGDLQSIVKRMSDTLSHRGPDDGGVWTVAQAGVALAQRRLSIIDLSPEGHQPMHSAGGRYTIIFNGEIYNYQKLRAELSGPFRGHSDTEVLLAAFMAWGVEEAIKRAIGMFAFALWDNQEQTLYLCRDRLGEKPLYYGWTGNTFIFGSELKALRAHPDWHCTIDRNALALFLRHNYIPTPYSIYEGIKKLKPGTMLRLTAADIGGKHEVPPRPYWSAREVAEQGTQNPFKGSDNEAIEQLEALLRDSVAQQMIADVPLGAFLSGGIDSSTIVALMQAQSERPVRTFTIGFHEAEFNEAEHAKAVARHLGTDHTELYVTPQETLDVIPLLPALYDEPFSDSSQIPTYLVAKLARQHVTVSLSGDAGDELFAGYTRYFWGSDIWKKTGWMPRTMKAVAAKGITTLSPGAWDSIFQKLDPVLPGKIRQSHPGDKLHKLAEILSVERPEAIYYGLVSHWKEPAAIVKNACEPPTVLTDNNQQANLSDFVRQMMYLDTVTYLPDDILVKVDRASMGVSLESRVPLLDHRVVEFAWTLPLSMKIRNGVSKWILRQVLYKHVPKELIERPKMGFGVPITDWLRGPLRDWAESLLSEKRLREEGYFTPEPIRAKWAEHLSGHRDWQYYLWDVLMFQAWLEQNR